MQSEKSTFFSQLQKEHRIILETLMDVKKMGVHTMDGRNALTAAKDLLCLHFKKEDELLYPTLRKTARKDKNKQQIIKAFVDEMTQVTRFCEYFFNKYSVSGGGIEFLQDFDRLYGQLENRLRKEESILFSIG
jgi:iron-sulfur cluster repair protein YtfE (RIC family)